MDYRKAFYVACLGLLGAGACGLWAVDRLGGWRYLAHRLHTQSAWPAYTQRLSQLELLPVPEPRSAVLIGDSHVAFGEWTALLPGISVHNRGIPGEGIEGLEAFAKMGTLGERTEVIVQVGTNDLLFHPPAWLTSRYDSLIAGLVRVGHRVRICTLPGVNNEVRWTGIDAVDVAAVNDHLRARQPSPTVNLIDVAAALGTKDGVLPAHLTDDGVHLRGPGYVSWASIMRPEIAASPGEFPESR